MSLEELIEHVNNLRRLAKILDVQCVDMEVDFTTHGNELKQIDASWNRNGETRTYRYGIF